MNANSILPPNLRRLAQLVAEENTNLFEKLRKAESVRLDVDLCSLQALVREARVTIARLIDEFENSDPDVFDGDVAMHGLAYVLESLEVATIGPLAEDWSKATSDPHKHLSEISRALSAWHALSGLLIDGASHEPEREAA